ncbi:hypothetical protein ACIRRH_39590 [Kitasatospora sp. NPDC101235]|uniref:hypothetical protein n=1 Tax=Kitasatospora sp. NPDC101235 TaxID=3364101 RepID=UPI0037F37EF7
MNELGAGRIGENESGEGQQASTPSPNSPEVVLSSLHRVDGQRVYAPAVGGRAEVLHLAVLVGRSTEPWAG